LAEEEKASRQTCPRTAAVSSASAYFQIDAPSSPALCFNPHAISGFYRATPFSMNIHEYQAKQLFQRFNIATPKGAPAWTPEEAEKIATELNTSKLVVKAQIHAGGRGKGTFDTGFKGGVKLCSTPIEARDLAEKMLGHTLVTHQTGPGGKVVSKVLVAESVDIAREVYFAILMDRAAGGPVVVASTEGGVEIEKVAEEHPEKIIRELVHPLLGFQHYQALKLGRQLDLEGDQLKAASKLFSNLYKLFVSLDCSLVEINPLVVTPEGDVYALDAKFNFDDNALYRHKDILDMRDIHEEDQREVEASRFGLNYIGLEGNIACLVNGAGLAMATMDIIKYAGGEPANFLDVGGGASEEQVTEAFKILVADKNVKAILVNIFGGIMRCDVIAQGIINAVKTVSLPVPLVVRLEGTNVQLGKKLLEQSRLPIQAATDLSEAAKMAVAAAKAM
jgi:succinyl-CoA synthetase beta subunit